MIRFGLHDFLNAQPLMVPLVRQQKELGVEIVPGVPRVLAEKLKAGELDLAMIPTVEYLKESSRYRLLPDVAIASHGEVGTVLLVSQVPLKKIKTLALDDRSRTSVALLKILFADRFDQDAKLTTSPPDPEVMLKAHDAALIIGDQAFSLPKLPTTTKVYDLSQEWFLETGKTFVHAVVAVREGVIISHEFCDKIQRAKEEGLREIADIAKQYVAGSGLDLHTSEDYLRNKIIYDLGRQELEGLTLFRDKCFDRSMIREKHEICFV